MTPPRRPGDLDVAQAIGIMAGCLGYAVTEWQSRARGTGIGKAESNRLATQMVQQVAERHGCLEEMRAVLAWARETVQAGQLADEAVSGVIDGLLKQMTGDGG